MKRILSVVGSIALASSVLVPLTAAAVAATSAASASPGRATVTCELITGDRVVVADAPGGRPQVTVVPARARSAFQVMTVGSQIYVVPQTAAGYLGAPLDPSLFDVTAMIAAGGCAPASAPLQVSVSSSDSSAPTAVPGLRMSTSGHGTLDRVGEARFGAALAAQPRPAKAGPRSLFAGISRIRLTGAAPATKPAPPGRLYTLTVKAFDRLGRKVTGSFADVMNVQDANDFLADQAFFNGVLKYSLPAGTYEIASFIPTQEADGSVDYSLVSAPQVTINRDTVVVLKARRANRLSVHTPDPTSAVTGQLALQRDAVAGPADGFTTVFVTFGSTALYAAPTAPVTQGQLYFYPYLRLGDATGSTDRYLYDLEFPFVGAIPRSLTESVTRAQLAAVDARYHSPYPGRAEFEARSGYEPWQASMTFGASTLAAPLQRTEYVLPQPGMRWLHDVITDEQDFFGFTQDTVRSYRPGQHLTDDWLGQPMPPGLDQDRSAGQTCPVCRTGDTLALQLMPYVDSDGHYQLPDPSVTSALSLYQNGALVSEQPSTFAQFPMSPDPASYRLELTQSRDAAWWPTTTQSDTTWTWSSRERPPDQLPPGWTCPSTGTGGRGGTGQAQASTGCSFEPLLFIGYRTQAGPDDVVPAGSAATVTLTVGHQYGATATPISAVTAQVSFDDGATWTAVTPTRTGGGTWKIHYPQPPLGQTSGFASLHVTAADAAGSSIDQTITRAYPLAVLPTPSNPSVPPAPAGQQPACGTAVAAPYARCMAIVNTAATAPGTDDEPAGYGPNDIRSAYALPDTGAGQTVAVVDAYDDPNAEADLAVYRTQYGLPACTSANGCFRKINQDGQPAPLPATDTGWGLEISLDLQAVSAACPRCHILLVEANSSSIADLGPAVDTAVAQGADVVSNSYGSTGEFSGEQYFEPYYHHRGVPIVVSTGDYGYGNGALLVESIAYPAASRYVTAVGGTTLNRDPNTTRGWTESAWSLATSGCSAYIHKPRWQNDKLCRNRTVADVSAVADPKTGLAVYDSFGWNGWLVVGGTSASAPIIASAYALAGNTTHQRYASNLYRNLHGFNDVTTGANGDNCSDTYLCTALPGYDGPTGLGTPHGVGSF